MHGVLQEAPEEGEEAQGPQEVQEVLEAPR